MADYDGFENNFEQANLADEDPAAEFLAREQDELAGIDDDGFVTAAANVNHAEELVGGSYEDFSGEFQEIAQMNGVPEPEPQPAAMPQVKPVVREEPEKIRKWREEQQVRLEEKDAEEEVKRMELRESAKRELEDWYRHHAEQVEKTKLQNRNAEKEYVMERDAEVPGQEWERIARLCDFNPKTSKNAKDVSRMRSIILQLKQNPPNNSPVNRSQ